MRGLLLLATAGLAGCGLPTGPGEIPEWIRGEWVIAQGKVATVYGRPEGRGIPPEQVRWEAIEGTLECGGVKANGCYDPGRREIRYNSLTPEVVRHEAGHAILHILGDPRWRGYEHEGG